MDTLLIRALRGIGNRPLLASILTILPIACSPPPPNPDLPIVRQIDHIKIVSSEAPALFALLSDTLLLPVVWPLTDYGGFSSGGVAVGNVNLEILSASDGASRITGFALEPEPLDLVLPALRARGIRHGQPSPYRSLQPDGGFETLWTTVALLEVSSDAVEVFFCEYTLDVASRRRRLQEELVVRAGGPLGVVSVRELIYGARNVDRMRGAWRQLLGPVGVSPDALVTLGEGPAIRLLPSDENGIQGVVLGVRSLPEARRILMKHGLNSAETSVSITMSGSPLQGLRFVLFELTPGV